MSLIGTPVLLVVCASTCLLVVMEFLPAIGMELVSVERPSTVGFAITAVCFYTSALLPFVAAAVLMGRTWKRTGRGLGWLAGALAMQVFIAAFTVSGLRLDTDPMSATVLFDSDAFAVSPKISQLLAQMALPVIVGASIVASQRAERRRGQLAAA